ncbi:MAG TPA: hypothetical protein VGP92_17435 [Acidimicrobiia bacterium]|jgi:hypothetical protein|nr:hypothetical protein [Acidimicrobiia bacterium]
MWGEVTPAERLRSVTRRNVDDDRLAAAAADALAGFSDEPASLVVACRRVLAHHRAHGQLWWVCSRILAAADPAAAAHVAVNELESDRTGDRLGATLPLLDENEVVAIIGYSSTVDDALLERFDLDAVAIRVEGDDPVAALRRRRSEHAVRVVDEWDPVLEHTARLLVPATAIGPERALVAAGAPSAIDTIGAGASETWLVGGVGRVLPARVYETLVSSLPADSGFEEISLQRFDRIAGPRGLERPTDATARIDCPIVPELLRPLD